MVVKKDLDDNLCNAFNVLAGQLTLNQAIVDLGGDPAQVPPEVAEAAVDVEALEEPYPYQSGLGIVAGTLIFMSLQLNGQMVAQGVVEEKSSRVVELLLSTIRPWQLMAGKVMGIGFVMYSLVWLSGRIYANAVMRSGARVKLKGALRPA